MLSVAIFVYSTGDREDTIGFLNALQAQTDGMKAEGQYGFDMTLVCDAADGTLEAAREAFPALRTLRQGGRASWSGAMRTAFEAAEVHDFYLLAQTGISLQDGAVASLMETSGFLRHRAIVAASAADTDGRILLGGRSKSLKLVRPDPVIPVPCHTFDGCLVLLPESARAAAGLPEGRYISRLRDYDWGFRAASRGVTRVVAPGIPALCTTPPPEDGTGTRERLLISMILRFLFPSK